MNEVVSIGALDTLHPHKISEWGTRILPQASLSKGKHVRYMYIGTRVTPVYQTNHLATHYTFIITDIAENLKIYYTFKLPPSVSTYYQCSQNIASVPFLSQVEVLTCDSSGCEYYNYNHGIMLRIPDDAIPPGMVIHLEVAVALYGPFQFPDGSCPISSILWLCFQENVELRKPIDIILPH